MLSTSNKTVRQSVSLPAGIAGRVRNLAKTRRLSCNRMLIELIENGIEAEKRKQQEFFELAGKFRTVQTWKKPSDSAMNWEEWCLAANAQG